MNSFLFKPASEMYYSLSPSENKMAEQKEVIRIKAVVNKEKNRVVFVESDHDFVDVILSFLTLPIGTIIRLIGMDQSSSNVMRCMSNLYNSVQNLETCHLLTKECKKMLLSPRRSSEGLCLNLKLKIDNKEPTQYYMCNIHSDTLSYSESLSCNCGSSQRQLMEEGKRNADGGAVFVKMGRYIIGDDMSVKYGSMDTCISMLGNHGITNWIGLEERNVDIGLEEVLLVLRRSLLSDTPMTDVILQKGGSFESVIKTKQKHIIQHSKESEPASSEVTNKVSVKLVIRKSNHQVLYAIAKEDFVDLLFSFLTFPLGSIVKLCGGTSSVMCIDNLYKSVGDLSINGQIVSQENEALLVCPKLAPYFACGKNQLLCVEEDEPAAVYYINDPSKSSISNDEKSVKLKLMNPMSANREETAGGGFIKGPSTFMVTNDLVVTPLCLTTGLFILKSLNVPINDVEELTVSIGKQEALNLLKASLVSDTALNSIISPRFHTPKKEVVD